VIDQQLPGDLEDRPGAGGQHRCTGTSTPKHLSGLVAAETGSADFRQACPPIATRCNSAGHDGSAGECVGGHYLPSMIEMRFRMTRAYEQTGVVVVSANDWRDLRKIADLTRRSFRTATLRSSYSTKTKRLTLVAVGIEIVAVALSNRLRRSGDLDEEVRFYEVYDLGAPVSFHQLLEQLSQRYRHWVNSALEHGGVLPLHSSEEMFKVLFSLRPECENVVRRLRSLLSPYSTAFRRTLLEEQRDTIALALEAAGIESRGVLTAWSEPLADAPFLAGLSSEPVSEAALIRHDANHFSDWLRIDGRIHDVVEFVDRDDPFRRITVTYADKEGLETSTGTDLVYYRHHSPGYVLVQYKRMKRNSSGKWRYWPDAQFGKQLNVMKSLELKYSDDSPTLADWRLSGESFYVKLCEDRMNRPEGNRLVPGMYFPVSLFELLVKRRDEVEPKGIGWDTAERYLSNGQFLELLRHGWIGSSGKRTAQLASLINETLASGRSVTIARDETDPHKAQPLRRG
jgi:hypothetical protein